MAHAYLLHCGEKSFTPTGMIIGHGYTSKCCQLVTVSFMVHYYSNAVQLR